ncbi:hypothetical protein [Paenibacillus sp. y28]|uniref:hypothetical protein n=1 Tax=Paenibacillus sp. y28 TaxID=3129110 RepID=UPI0030192C2C
MKMKKRWMSSVLVAASLFVAALPAQASQYVDMDEYSSSTLQSTYQSGNSIYVSIYNYAPNYNWGDIQWEVIDGYSNVIASGTAYNPYDVGNHPTIPGSYYEGTIAIDGNNQNQAKLVLTCTTGRCSGSGYIEGSW